MTMSSAVSKVTLNGDGVQTEFPFGFKVWKAADLEVSITNAAGVTTVVSNWSVSLADTGGTVTYPTSGPALPSGHKITIARSMDFLQDVDLVSGTRWDPEVVETALDRATAERQQLKERLDRAVVVDIAATTTPEALLESIYAARDTAVDNAASALNSANAASVSATAAVQSATQAANSATQAAQSAVQATNSATQAAQSAVQAANSATQAAQSAAAADQNATAAAQSATQAANGATQAAQSATDAAASATAAANSFDAFDDRYLGSKASDPTVDNDGNALLTGALYWNTTVNEMRVWNGAAWRTAAGSLVGNADTATKLQTARTLTIGNTGKSFDGASDVAWSLSEIGVTAATETASGIVELADAAEAQAGTDTVRAVTPQGLAAYAGALSFRNKIINGKMEVSQRGTSWNPAHATMTYTLDRFLVYEDTDGSVSVAQSTDAPTGFQNSLRVTVSTADAALGATQRCLVDQRIEGYNVRDLVGRTFTLSFWVRSAKTGTHCVSFVNSGADRSYVAEYTVNAANTWEYKTITVPGGIPGAGTWNFQNGVGMYVRWALCAGSSWQTTAGSWATGDFIASPNQVNVLDTANNIFAITGVQLELGSYATQFEHRPYGLELALCQRYFWKPESSIFVQGYASVPGGNTYQTVLFPARMRTTPAVTAIFSDAVNATGSVVGISPSGFQVKAVSTTAGTDYAIIFTSSSSASAEI